MPQPENLRVNRAAWDALNAHDLDRWASLLDAQFVWESDTLPFPVEGPEAARQAMALYFAGFPDLHFELEEELASGGTVVTHWRSRGTHTSDFAGVPPTGKQASVRGCTVAEVRGGKLTRARIYWDSGRLLQQLGVTPPAPA